MFIKIINTFYFCTNRNSDHNNITGRDRFGRLHLTFLTFIFTSISCVDFEGKICRMDPFHISGVLRCGSSWVNFWLKETTTKIIFAFPFDPIAQTFFLILVFLWFYKRETNIERFIILGDITQSILLNEPIVNFFTWKNYIFMMLITVKKTHNHRLCKGSIDLTVYILKTC